MSESVRRPEPPSNQSIRNHSSHSNTSDPQDNSAGTAAAGRPQRPSRTQTVFTNKAACRDCYRCLRVCPVKAIRMEKGQASVVEERCISCGTCVRECPQKAKSYRHDLEQAIRLLKEHRVVALSLAPSFVVMFAEWERKRIPSAFRKMGFAYVGETSIGAYPVAQASARDVEKSGECRICTACPAVVNFVEKYHPDVVEKLSPVASPMVAHARMIKEKLGPEARIVFIGPCIAKKSEADRPEYHDLIDCVLTFEELEEWFAREKLRLDLLEESAFDDQPAGEARFFPLPGGLTKTAHLKDELLASDILAVSGFDDVRRLLETLGGRRGKALIEPLFCAQGCINGPALPPSKNVYERREELLAYAKTEKGVAPDARLEAVPVSADYKAAAVDAGAPVHESDIANVLAATGKSRLEDQLNCGACGYSTCREKAIAVLRGLAETEMCIPYMRRLAERRTDKIIETSPNGIVILDERLHILSMNPAFRTYFLCSEALLGKHISYLVDPEPFERLATGKETLIEATVTYEKYNLTAHQIAYPLKEEKQFVGIFVNITNSKVSQAKLEEMRAKTIAQARELLEHQIDMAQKMAKFLGESSARGEELVQSLMKLASDRPGKGKDDAWLKDIFMLK